MATIILTHHLTQRRSKYGLLTEHETLNSTLTFSSFNSSENTIKPLITLSLQYIPYHTSPRKCQFSHVRFEQRGKPTTSGM